MKTICPICQGAACDHQICWLCADIIEFGYPSFPAYRLEEGRKMEESKKLVSTYM
jgi:hypothetical protein